MTKAIVKPSFREVVAVTTMNLDDLNLQFNAQRVGPMNFAGLRSADYGSGFKMPTMPQLVPLVYASLENQNYGTAQNVVQTIKSNWLTGNTGILYTQKGMFAQDNPQIENGLIVMDEKTLEAKLGKTENKGVIFSDDRNVRFTPYGFKRESQSASELAKNPGVIAFSGSVENAEMLALSSEHYKPSPYFWALTNVSGSQIRVAFLVSYNFDAGLDVCAVDSEHYEVRCSFGVSPVSVDAEGVAPKKQ